MQVFAARNTANHPGDWQTNGGFPGASSLLFQGGDGTTWSYTLNERSSDEFNRSSSISSDPEFLSTNLDRYFRTPEQTCDVLVRVSGKQGGLRPGPPDDKRGDTELVAL